jgi:hypothetical protein
MVAIRPSVRLLAVIGFCAAAMVCIYHLPSYMLPG